jgi:nucleotide-binding universal stress UspA family protein
MQRIIVPIDFSEEALKGLKLAIIYANKFKADLQMVYVIKEKSVKFHVKMDNIYNCAIEEFEQIIKDYKPKLHQDCDFSYIIKKGKVHEEVTNQAEAFDDSVIICSTNGESGFSEYLMGSNAYKIVQNTSRPVITLTTETYIRDIRKIVMPLDITKETREKIPIVAKIAKAFDAEVHILLASSSKNEGIHTKLKMYATQAKKFFDKHEIKYISNLIVGDNITDTIIEYSKTIDADLIAVMTEQTMALTNFLIGSYAYQMLNASPIPVLSVTPKGLFFTSGVSTTGA